MAYDKDDILEDILRLVDDLNKVLERATALGFEWEASVPYSSNPRKIALSVKSPVIKDNVKL